MSTSSSIVTVRGVTSKRQIHELDEKIENIDREEVAVLRAAPKLPKTLGSAIRT